MDITLKNIYKKTSSLFEKKPSISVIHSLNNGRTRPMLGDGFKTRNPMQWVSVELKPCNIDDTYYPKLRKKIQDLEVGYFRLNNKKQEEEIYKNDLATFLRFHERARSHVNRNLHYTTPLQRS